MPDDVESMVSLPCLERIYGITNKYFWEIEQNEFK